MFKDKTLLITGGTGSFGNAVLTKILNTDIKEIRIFSRDEKKQDDMRRIYKNDKLQFILGDVRNYDSLNYALNNVDYVFHAAALKQVPSCEFYPLEAIKTNILGTQNLLNASISNGVKKVVCLSTDKAAYPINAMGMSKALMEKVALSTARHVNPKDTSICITRYGNVMASRGSVIPLFIEQIKKGENLTITDPEMTRFMMSLDDAVNLVLFAFKNTNQGDLFIQKAPAATIKCLAQALSELFKINTPNIKIIGTRHGEKLFETLATREELYKAQDLGNYYRIPSDNRTLNYDNYIINGKKPLSISEDYNSHNTKRLNVEELKQMLLKLDYIKKELIKL